MKRGEHVLERNISSFGEKSSGDEQLKEVKWEGKGGGINNKGAQEEAKNIQNNFRSREEKEMVGRRKEEVEKQQKNALHSQSLMKNFFLKKIKNKKFVSPTW